MKPENNTAANTALAATLSFGPKDIRAKYEALIQSEIDAGNIKIGKEASCGKSLFLSIYAGMLVEMGVIPPSSYAAAYSIMDELPANASAMRQDFEKWNEAEVAASKKGSALAARYGA